MKDTTFDITVFLPNAATNTMTGREAANIKIPLNMLKPIKDVTCSGSPAKCEATIVILSSTRQ